MAQVQITICKGLHWTPLRDGLLIGVLPGVWTLIRLLNKNQSLFLGGRLIYIHIHQTTVFSSKF